MGRPLEENKGVRQRPDEGFRRWFVNAYFEVIVWYDKPGGELTGFQLCVDRHQQEHAFTWTKEYAAHHFVSTSLQEPGVSRLATGILRGTGREISERDLNRLRDEQGDLDEALLAFIVEKVTQRQKVSS